MRFLGALLAVALLCAANALQGSSVSASNVHSANSVHGCAPPIPPAVPGSPVPAPATPGIIRINEALLVPHSIWNCSEATGYSLTDDMWIELYNPQNQPFNLYTAHATIDAGPNPNIYYPPFGAAIASHGFLVLFPGAIFSNLFLGTPSPQITLSLLIGGVPIDQVTVPSLTPDQSYARIPDGGNTWQLTGTPTIDASNTGSQASTSSGSSGSGSGGSGNSPQALVNGTQPAWSSLKLPSLISATAPPDNASQNNAPQAYSSSPTTSTSSVSDVPRRILLTLLVVALALTLFWCWRLFTH